MRREPAEESLTAMSGGEPAKLLLVCSSGGHLAQLVAARSWWEQHERTWVTFDLPDARARLAGEVLVPAYSPTTRNIKNLIRNLGLAIRVMGRDRPDLVVSTGAAVAVPFFLVAKIMRVPRIYIEVFDRIDSPTLSGRLCRPLSTVFCVQLERQLDVYPGATVIGPML